MARDRPTKERIPTEELLDLIPEVKWNNLYGSGVQVEDDPADELYALIYLLGPWYEPPLLPDPDEQLAKATSPDVVDVNADHPAHRAAAKGL